MKETILHLVKFFEKEEYADQFMQGRLYLNRLRYYKRLEASCSDGRPPVLFSFDSYGDLNILCMTAIHAGDFDYENGLISLVEGDEDKLRSQLKLDSRCSKMGSIAVMVRAGDFVLRIKNAIEPLGYSYSSTLVDYFDPAIFHGRFPLAQMPFRKRNIFSYQNEYRICVDTHTKGEDAVVINIGDIGDLAAKMPAANVNANYQIRFTSPAVAPANGAGRVRGTD